MLLTFWVQIGVASNQTPKPGKPFSIKRGSVTVKIYAAINRVNGTEYPQFILAY